MWRHIEFIEGNPYITITDEEFWRIVRNYYLEQTGAAMFKECGSREEPKGYAEKQEVLRSFAMEWQNASADIDYSYEELAEWNGFFEKYGKKYGLLREFRENGII